MSVDAIAAARIEAGLAPQSPGTGATSASGAFGDTLGRLIGSVDSSAAGANAAVGNMLQGTGDVHEAMIALQTAEMTLELTVQVRNKLVQAYQDMMRMPI